MITIEKCSEYNVRIMKTPDFKNKIHGYNFAYPVMNSIDICNLFISGGDTEISMNGKSKSTFSFNVDSNTLTITEKNQKKLYTIDNPAELGETMVKYFEEHQSEILKKTLETNMKKSKSKEGNQNARKSDMQQPDTTDNLDENKNAQSNNLNAQFPNEVTEDVSNHKLERIKKILDEKNIDERAKEKILKQLKNPEFCLSEFPLDCFDYKNHIKLDDGFRNNVDVKFCQLCEYINQFKHKSIGEYYYWVVSNNKHYLLDSASQEILRYIGYNPYVEYKDWRQHYTIKLPPKQKNHYYD